MAVSGISLAICASNKEVTLHYLQKEPELSHEGRDHDYIQPIYSCSFFDESITKTVFRPFYCILAEAV